MEFVGFFYREICSEEKAEELKQDFQKLNEAEVALLDDIAFGFCCLDGNVFWDFYKQYRIEAYIALRVNSSWEQYRDAKLNGTPLGEAMPRDE